jgi:ribosomal protein S18 acetylase RimI-like enzyme
MGQITGGERGNLNRLVPADHAALARLLDRDRVATVFMRSELRLAPNVLSWWGLTSNGGLRAALMGGPLVVPWIPDPGDAVTLAGALWREPPFRLMVGPAPSVRSLAAAITARQRPVEARDPQPLLLLDHSPQVPEGVHVRRGQRGDLGQLTIAAAAMHREEMGIDPMAVDPVGWRARMATLVSRGWSYIWPEGGEIIFKVELSAWTPEVVQLQGVWTNPRRRRQGIASAGLAAVCAEVLRDVPLCSLYVNAYNSAALRLYDRLGFRQVGEFATVMY